MKQLWLIFLFSISAGPVVADDRQQQIHSLLSLAEKHLDQEEFSPAITFCDAILYLDPGNKEASDLKRRTVILKSSEIRVPKPVRLYLLDDPEPKYRQIKEVNRAIRGELAPFEPRFLQK